MKHRLLKTTTLMLTLGFLSTTCIATNRSLNNELSDEKILLSFGSIIVSTSLEQTSQEVRKELIRKGSSEVISYNRKISFFSHPFYEEPEEYLKEKIPQFSSTFKNNADSKTISIHLPLPIFEHIFEKIGLRPFFKNSRVSNYDKKIPVLCEFSYSEKLKQDIEEAWTANNKMTIKQVDWNTLPPIVLKSTNGSDSFDQILNHIFVENKQKGLIIGEQHDDLFTQYLFYSKLKYLFRDYHIQRIYAEFLPVQLQPLVNHYLSADDIEMPSLLSNYLDETKEINNNCFEIRNTLKLGFDLSKMKGTCYKDILVKAKKVGIKEFIGIDDTMYLGVNQERQNTNAIADRIVVMNQLFAKLYKSDQKNSIVFCGQAHNTEVRNSRLNKSVYGIREITGFPVINSNSFLTTDWKSESQGIHFHEQRTYEKYTDNKECDLDCQQGDFDYYYELPEDSDEDEQ